MDRIQWSVYCVSQPTLDESLSHLLFDNLIIYTTHKAQSEQNILGLCWVCWDSVITHELHPPKWFSNHLLLWPHVVWLTMMFITDMLLWCPCVCVFSSDFSRPLSSLLSASSLTLIVCNSCHSLVTHKCNVETHHNMCWWSNNVL